MRRLQWIRVLGLGLTLGVSGAALTGCGVLDGLMGGSSDPATLVAGAKSKLASGDLPGATSEFESLASSNPTSVEAQMGLSYMKMLAGDHGGADAVLKAALDIPELPEDVASQIALRRALVALAANDLDAAQAQGEKSGLSPGLVIAAEVYLRDAEIAEAMPLLERAAADASDPVVQAAAREYLEYLGDTSSGRAQLAEATALWSLGQREDACEAAEELLLLLPGEVENRDAMLLLWAGRAVSSNQPVIASALIDDTAPPPNQAWRVQATRALISVANGEIDEAVTTFDQLQEGGAPTDGLVDAWATALMLSKDKGLAAQLVEKTGGKLKSAAFARGLLAAGAVGDAKSAAPAGTTLSAFLEAQ